MKFSCELVVFEILPTARRELAKELVRSYGMSQIKVADMFGITGSAVSQYMKGSRGQNDMIFRSSYVDKFMDLIAECAKMLAEGKSDLVVELCKICTFTKSSGMLDEINGMRGTEEPYSRCQECPNTDYDGPGKDFVFKK